MAQQNVGISGCFNITSSIRGRIRKFTDWVTTKYTLTLILLVETQHKGPWLQNSLDWLTK